MTECLCPFCQKPVLDDTEMYLVNPAGKYGMPEKWACEDCLRNAEPGSILAEKWESYSRKYGLI